MTDTQQDHRAGRLTAPLDVRADGEVLVITLNRPASRNAVNQALAEAVEAAIDRLDADADLRVGVIAGEGPAFCAGMDLKAFALGERSRTPRRGFAGLTSAPPAKPLIAAVDGPAMGGGFEIVLACDLVVASERARFGLPEVRRGLTAAGGGLFRLPRRIPYHQAMEVILEAEPLAATRAQELGLVNYLVPAGAARAHALEVARRIAANGPLAVRASKQIIVDSQDWPLAEAFDRQADLCELVRTSDDAREGAAAFVEKRPPVWSGK